MDIRLDNRQLPAPASLPRASEPKPGATRPAAPAPQPSATAAPAPSNRAVAEQIARQISRFLESSSVNLQFVVDRDSSKVVVRIVDPETDVVIRQIPSEELVAISKALENMSGLLLKQRI